MYNIIWFRNDLRLADNPALYHASNEEGQLIPIFILDEINERKLGSASKWFLHHTLAELERSLGKIHYFEGDAYEIIKDLHEQLEGNVQIFYNRKYTAGAIKRDKKIDNEFNTHSLNGSLLYEPWQIKNKQGDYYKVFTAFKNACLRDVEIKPCYPKSSVEVNTNASIKHKTLDELSLLDKKINWAKDFNYKFTENDAASRLNYFLENKASDYKEKRNFPDEDYTSKLSPHLTWGIISPRQIYWQLMPHYTEGAKGTEQFLWEIIWREFSYNLLYHNPNLHAQNFRPEFDNFPWENNSKFLSAWQKGQTGYPIVDAGMRELWATGWMHNRVRMITASFLTKHLLIDWREGEKWFWDCLCDADPANNSASWQWVAGCGADAAPYFRIFNPITQGEKFDKSRGYVRKWVPEIAHLPNDLIYRPWEYEGELDYPKPIIDHSFARNRALKAYEKIKK